MNVRNSPATTVVNGQWIRDMFVAIDSGDWDRLLTFFHPEIVYERPGYEPFVGRDRVMRFYREERVIAGGTHTLDGTVVEDGRAAGWGRIDALRTDGEAVALRFADAYLIEDERIRLRRSHFFLPGV